MRGWQDLRGGRTVWGVVELRGQGMYILTVQCIENMTIIPFAS